MQVTIRERRCPRCEIRRTVRLGQWGSVCFNCRLQWNELPSGARRPAEPSDATSSLAALFTGDEIVRLERYRAAVKVGFYTDSLPTLAS